MTILEAFEKHYLETGENCFDDFSYMAFPNWESAIDELISLGIVYQDNFTNNDIYFTDSYLKKLTP